MQRRVQFFKPHRPIAEKQYQRRLVATVLVTLLIASMLPVLLIGTLTYYRTRDIMRTQTSEQLSNLVNQEVDRLRTYVDARINLLDQIATDPIFNTNLGNLIATDPTSSDYGKNRSLVFVQLQSFYDYRANAQEGTTSNVFFDELFILRKDGTLLISTNDNWVGQRFGTNKVTKPFVLDLIGTNDTVIFNDPSVILTSHLVVVTTRSFVNDQGEILATMFTMSTTPLFNRILTDSATFFPGGSAFFFTPSKANFGPDGSERLIQIAYDPTLMLHIIPVTTNGANHIFFETENQVNVPVMNYALWMPQYQIGLSVTVPQASIYGQVHLFSTYNLIVLMLSLMMTAGMIYLGTTRMVNPLVRLSQIAENFSRGNWDERSNIQRTDEIGLLAHSFDAMADDLSALYHSMEDVVEKRTSQLRIASEVAQLASSTTHLSETLEKMVALIAERFGYYHVALYLVDDTGHALVLTEASGPISDQLKQRSDRIPIDTESLIGSVAAGHQFRMIKDMAFDQEYKPDPLLPDTQSQLAVPISINQQVMGVLDIQSTLINAFDNDTVSVMQTLANQVSTALQNTRLLETTQINYQETSLLYRTTRIVTQARSEDEIISILGDVLVQLPYVSTIFTADESIYRIMLVADYKTERVERNLQNIHIPIRNMGQMLLEQRVVLIEDINQAYGYEGLLSTLLRRGCKSAALLAIISGGNVTKVLALGSRESERITHASLQPYANLVEVINATLDKFRVLNTLQQRLSELQVLASFSQAISAETDLNHLYRVLLDQVMQTMGTDIHFAVALYNETTNMIEVPFRYEQHEYKSEIIAPFPLGEGLTSYMIQNRKPLLITSGSDPIIEQLNAKQVGNRPAKSWMGIPLIFAGRMVGAIIIQDEENENRFSQNDVNLFMTLAPQIATSIRNAELITETQTALHAYDQEHFLLNNLLDNSPDGITFKDVNGRYIRASQSMAEVLQVEHVRVEGSTDFDLFDRERANEIWMRQSAILDSGQSQTEIVETQGSAEQNNRWWQVTTIPIYETDRKPYGLLIVQREITDLKLTEALAQRRAEHMHTAAEIARDTTGTLDVDALLQKSVNLVRERFGFYHASIFLVDSLEEYAVLRESTGSAGETMKASGHRLAIGSKSIVGQATALHKPIVVNFVTNDPSYYPNPLLPDTRSELAIPLMDGERILGALDVQSDLPDAFKQEDINILQILADQLAVAVVNGELFGKTQELLNKHRLLRQVTTVASTGSNLEETLLNVVRELVATTISDRIAIFMLNTEGHLQIQASAGFEGTAHLEVRISIGQGTIGRAALEKHPIRVGNVNNAPDDVWRDPQILSELAIPILFTDELIGVLFLESRSIASFDENDEEILGALGSNLGGVIANIRLLQQVRQQVEREQVLYEATSKIRRSVDLETILETSTREICRALGARRASIQISTNRSAPQITQNSNDLPTRDNGVAGKNGKGHNGNGNNGNGSHGQEPGE